MAIREHDPVTRLVNRGKRTTGLATRNQSHEKLVSVLIDRLRVRAEQTETTTLRELVDRLHDSEFFVIAKTPTNPVVNILTHGQQYDPVETVMMELELNRRGFELRRKLLNGALTTTEVANLLGTKRQTPHDRVKSGTLLGIEENGRWLFPYWQFDPAGPNGVVSGLLETLRALASSAVAKANWLTLPNPYLEGRTPIQALKDGERERVVDIARAVGTN